MPHSNLHKFLGQRFLVSVSGQMLSIAVGWQVYALTHRAIDLGFVGLVQFLPAMGLSIISGHVADRYQRARILRITLTVDFLVSVAFAILAYTGHLNVYAIYLLLFILGCAHAFGDSASQSLLPSIVTQDVFPRAAALNSSTWQVASIAGPALGGLLYGWAGRAAPVYATAAVGHLVGLFLVMAISSYEQPLDKGPITREALLGGIKYVWRTKEILGSISLDLFAVLLGGATALLPAYANDILKVGPTGLGILRSAPAVGAATMALFLTAYPIRKHAGRKMFFCVGLFGALTMVFGLSHNFYLSLACVAVMGAADLVSVVVRHTLVQMETPPHMRGRVSAVNLVFIGASNELGEFESGLTAAWLGLVPAVIVGGAGTCLVVLLWIYLFPSLYKLDQLKVGEGKTS